MKLEQPLFFQQELLDTVTWLNDPVLMQYSEQRHKEHTVQSQLECIHAMSSKPNHYRKITVDGAYVGTISAWVDTVNNVADVGILIGPPHTGAGYGRAAWRMFSYELGKLGIRKIEGGCMSMNTGMIRIFEKNHMRLEGTRKYHFVVPGGECDMLLYGSLT